MPMLTTYRFAIDTAYLPSDIDAIPSIKKVAVSPAIVSLGADLGQRGTITVDLRDHRHIFNGEDFTSGTFWGKFRGRYGLKLRGYSFRLLRGLEGDSIDAMETRHYVIESTDGPSRDGEFRIVAKDILKFADSDRAQAPVLSNGFLVSDITNVATTATLSPTGIGDEEYPTSGYVAIGGKEICAFTRSADVLTLTRAQFNTEAQAHESQDRVQLCLEYDGEDVADIIADLLITYAGVPQSYIPLSSWLTETGTYLNQVYSALIAEPTAVNQLVSELIEQVGLVVWWDDVGVAVRLQVLRAIPNNAFIFSEANVIMDSLEVTEQPEKRLSQVYFYFAKINPLVQDDEPDNYRSSILVTDADAETEYNGAVVKKIFSRWVPIGGRTVAETAAENLLSRFRDPPRRIKFNVLRYSIDTPALAGGYLLEAWPFQDETGAAVQVPIQITSLVPDADKFIVEGEEMLFAEQAPDSPSERTIVIDGNVSNVNLLSMHDSIYTTAVSGDTVTCIIYENVIVSSTSPTLPAFHVGDGWAAGVTINLTVLGRIQGMGGTGGVGGSAIFASSSGGTGGGTGGTALYTRYAINLTSTDGEIWAGGGGGGGGGGLHTGAAGYGGGGGGGGTGTNGGTAGAGGFGSTISGGSGTTGTATAGGSGGTAIGVGVGGAGGSAGSSGSAGGTTTTTAGGAGGSGGAAIDGDSFVTDIGSIGSILGGQIN